MRLATFFALTLIAGAVRAAEPPTLDDSMCLPGKVLEATDVDAYTYLRLETGDGETWAAIDRAPVETGRKIAIVQATVMQDFWSRQQQKTYEWIVFGRLAESCEPQAMADAAMAAHKAAGLGNVTGMPASGEPIRVAKADGPGGRTVAEVVAGSASLDDNRVAVRGRVVRYTSDVMGKNWIHLQDGSGSAAEGTNDILVTTLAQAKAGEIVLVKGVVHTNRDFGAGYAYKVLIEEATLER